MTEVERVIGIIMSDLLKNEYAGPMDENLKAFLTKSAARRIVQKLDEQGYIISAKKPIEL